MVMDTRGVCRNWAGIALAGTLMVTGCQSVFTDIQGKSFPEFDFGTSWSTYTACRKSLDIQDLLKKTEILGTLIDSNGPTRTTEGSGVSSHLADFLRVNKPRYSADPQVMALDCWLHAGEVAELRGETEIAHQLYSRVLRVPRTTETAYFVTLAESSLGNLRLSLQAAANSASSVAPSN